MRESFRPAWLSTLLSLLLTACPEAPVRPPPPPASVAPAPLLPHVPPGCETNLAGLYLHRDDGTFRYQVDDDGSTLHVHAFRQYGSQHVELANAADIELRRTATGIHGESRATVPNQAGKSCPVVFPYELTACESSGLTLRTAQQLSVDAACHLEDAVHLNLIENVLVRAPTPDAGASLDAGPTTLDGG